MARGEADARMTPALVFCFNRDECWTVAEQIKGKKVLSDGQQARLVEELNQHDWSQGAGTKLRQLLLRGVGVHHAGLLPKYRRIVEMLFQRKLLSVAICTETLAAGINLPARSVVLPTILKGPPDKKRVIEASAAHQIFGRAGRPQFDTQGHVYVLAHEDDVKIARWHEQYDRIPEDTKDPGLMKAKKAMKRKMPHRRDNEQYWNEAQFQKLVAAPPGKLYSRGPLPWRLLGYMLDASPEIDIIRRLVGKRLMDSAHLEAGPARLGADALVLHKAGYVRLEPEPGEVDGGRLTVDSGQKEVGRAEVESSRRPTASGALPSNLFSLGSAPSTVHQPPSTPPPPPYRPALAHPTAELPKLALFRSVNPLFGMFLVRQLGIADRKERIQAFESALDFPAPVARYVRVPKQEFLPPGPLATLRLDQQLLQLGLATVEELVQKPKEEEEPWKPRRSYDAQQDEEPKWVLTLAEKLRRLFDYEYPGVFDLRTRAVWAAGELLLEFNGNFNKYVGSKDLLKQEGIVFRHLLRLILLLARVPSLGSARSRSVCLALRSGRSRRSAHGKLPRGRSHQHGSRAGNRRRAGRRGGEVRRGTLRLRRGIASLTSQIPGDQAFSPATSSSGGATAIRSDNSRSSARAAAISSHCRSRTRASRCFAGCVNAGKPAVPPAPLSQWAKRRQFGKILTFQRLLHGGKLGLKSHDELFHDLAEVGVRRGKRGEQGCT